LDRPSIDGSEETSCLAGESPYTRHQELDHAGVHQHEIDAIAALETKVGIERSAVTTSLDDKVAHSIVVVGTPSDGDTIVYLSAASSRSTTRRTSRTTPR
jgi:hypothetical protein